MVSQFMTNDAKQRKKRFLGELGNFPAGSMAVGRLDEDSEGLLLITTNGKLSDTINKSATWEKEYYAQLDGIITDAAICKLQQGLLIGIDGTKVLTRPCKVSLLKDTPLLPQTQQRIRDERHGPTSWITITLTEGKFRQVRKMTSAVGFPTLRLARVRINQFTLKNLQEMQVIDVSAFLKDVTL